VGFYRASPQWSTLIEHWNGTAWSIVASPNQGTIQDNLYAVGVVSANDVWAVGQYYNGSVQQTLVEHWNGTTWSVVPSPNQPTTYCDYLNAVGGVSANDVWAVGEYYNGTLNANQTLVEHYSPQCP
jgi:hypothetical protein